MGLFQRSGRDLTIVAVDLSSTKERNGRALRDQARRDAETKNSRQERGEDLQPVGTTRISRLPSAYRLSSHASSFPDRSGPVSRRFKHPLSFFLRDFEPIHGHAHNFRLTLVINLSYFTQIELGQITLSTDARGQCPISGPSRNSVAAQCFVLCPDRDRPWFSFTSCPGWRQPT